MRLPHFSGLRARLLLLLLLAVLPWGMATIHDLVLEWKDARAHAVADLRALAEAAGREQRTLVEETRILLKVLAALPEVAAGDADACESRLLALRLGEAYLNVGVIGPDGVLLCDVRGGRGTDLGDREYLRRVREQRDFVAGPYIVGRITGKPAFPLAYPVLDGQGRVRRVVFAALDTGFLQRVLEARARPGMTLALLDLDGRVLARVPAAAKQIGRPHPSSTLRDAIRGGSTGGVLETADPEPSLLVHSVLTAADRTAVARVVARVPTALLEAPLRKEFTIRFALLGAATVVIFALAWLLGERLLVRKVEAMRALAARIAAGDLTARSGVTAGGELGELARALDTMAAALQKSHLETERIMEVAPEGILLLDRQGRIVMANARCELLFGYAREELLGRPIELLLPEERRSAYERLRNRYLSAPTLGQMGSPELELEVRRKDGTVFPAEVSLGSLQSEDGVWVVAVVRDVSERRHFEAEILRQATHDALTGLPNRMLFRQLLEQAMSQAQRDETLLAVLFLDLDGFKTINDTLGHVAGDALLVQVAGRIRRALRASDVVARQGGDEFTILLTGVRQVPDVSGVAEKLLSAVAKPYEINGMEVNMTASVGITLYPIDDADAESLLRNADTAMYRAKHDGRNRYSYYTAQMNAEVRQRLELETGLRQALREGQFEVFYQPQVAVDSGQWVALEALIRWRHPERGLISPAEFIPVAEDSGLIEPIGAWVLTEVCRQIAEWNRKGLPQLRVAVNLSARQFANVNLVDEVAAILTGQGVRSFAEQIELEVTESILMGNMAHSVAVLQALRGMGLNLAIDDFGTGYSSLSYLRRFPLTALKIDRSFIAGVVDEAGDAAIARAIIELGHSLGLLVVAEGVETSAQWDWLRAHGCDRAQGYLFGRPMPAADIEARLTQGAAVRSVA